MSRQLRIGLLGASRVATYAIIEPARRIAGVSVAAVAARDRSRAEAFACEHGIGRVHDSYSDLVDDPDIDLIYIGTPPAMHLEQALLAIAAGKPTLVEKPFALSSAEAARVFDAAEKANVPVFEAMHSPHHRLFARVLEIARSGEIGKIGHIEAEFSVGIPDDGVEFRWREGVGGGALMDLGVYPLAWVRRVAGDDFSIVQASADFKGGVDASFAARLEFASGVSASIRSSMVVPTPQALLTIEGSLGRLEAINPIAPQRGNMLRITVDGDTRSEIAEGPSSYEAQLAAVRATLVDGARFPFAPGDFVRSMEAIDAVRAAFPLHRDP